MRTFGKHIWTAIVVASVCLLHTASFAAKSVSQFGITWTWTEDRQVGQFANGDWWVVGPITLTSISPATSGGMNGTMINPSITNPVEANGWKYTQAWDSRTSDCTYVPSLNIASQLPYAVAVNSSVCSAKSLPSALKQGGGTVVLDTIAVLTVLPAAPPEGSFRPTYYGSNKTIKWNKSQIQYGRLRSLPPVAGLPTLATAEAYYDHPYIVLGGEYFANYHAPVNNLPVYIQGNPNAVGAYGREYQAAAQAAGILLNLNYSNAEKEKLAIGMIQFGLDVYEAAARGCYWEANGGWQQGRKLPLIMAGYLLNDPNIMTVASNSGAYVNKFQEDCQHFYVTQNDISLARCPIQNRPTAAFTQAMLGMAEWGERYCESPCTAGSNFDLYYRDVNGIYGFGVFVVLHLMGLLEEWGDPAFGDYYRNRWYGTWTGSSSPQYVKDLWTTYRNATPPNETAMPVMSPGGGTYTNSQTITITSGTSGAAIYYTSDGSTPTTSSTRYANPITVNATTTIKAIATSSGMNNSSVRSETYIIGQPDTQAPSVPGAVSATAASSSQINLTWSASTDNVGVTGYRIYRNGTQAGTATGTTYSDTGLTANTPYSYTVAAHDAAGNLSSQSTTASATTLPGSSGQAAAPVISPPGATSFSPVSVSLSSSTAGAEIYYTLDGSTPSANSTRYTTPIQVGSTATLKAIAVASGMADSAVSSAEFVISSFTTAPGTWQNVAIPEKTTSFTISFDMTPAGAPIDSVTGLSFNPASSFSDMAVILRFASSGIIDARDGATYQAVNSVSYSAGTSYHVVMNVDMTAKRYSATVTPENGNPVVIASDYAFRTEQAGVASLNNLCFTAVSGSHTVGGVTFSPAPPRGLRILTQ